MKKAHMGKRLWTVVLVAAALLGGCAKEETAGPLTFKKACPEARHIVAIDSGHGGQDCGAKGLVKETQVTQATAAELMRLLEADPAYYPVQVHADDEDMKSQQRVKVAAAANAELFLSLHANKDSSASSHGFECFAVPPGRAYHDESFRLAGLVCEQMQKAGMRLRGETGVRYAYYRNGAKIMKEASDENEYAYPTFGVLQKACCPAVLAEQCFISSAADLDQMGDEDGCRLAAACYYRAVCAYFGTQPLPAAEADASSSAAS